MKIKFHKIIAGPMHTLVIGDTKSFLFEKGSSGQIGDGIRGNYIVQCIIVYI